MFNNFFSKIVPFVRECRKILTQTKIWRMRISCWMANATYIHSDNVKLIAFPRQQWFRESS